MRILYVGNAQGFGNASRYYLFPQRLINGFTRCGHNVYVFNDRDVARYSNVFRSSGMGKKAMNEALIQTCADYKPQLIVLGHCEKVENETLADLYEMLPGLKIIYRNVDPLECGKNCGRITNRAKMVDAVFVTTAGDALKQFSGHKAFAAFLPNPVDRALDTGRSFEGTYETDLFFAASPLGDDDRRKVFLEALLPKLSSDIRFNLIGAGINGRKIFGEAFVAAMSKSNMGLILNKTEDFYLYASDRMSQYLGNGLFVLCPKGPAYTDIFDQGEIMEYEDEEDLAEKTLYYKKNDGERRTIAQKSYERAHEIFDCKLIAQYMIDMVFDGAPEKAGYAWPVTKV